MSRIVSAVRIRPLNKRELQARGMCVVDMQVSNTVQLSNGSSSCTPRHFSFDHVFWSVDKSRDYSDQVDVYRKLALPLLRRAIEGYNSCLFAYGMTSTGKSYSITGPPNNPGILPRLAEDVFKEISNEESNNCSFSVEISYCEIYNEKIRDLLTPNKDNLCVREHPMTGPYIEGLCRLGVRSKTDVLGWLRKGDCQRTVASTWLNGASSRSHAIFTFYVTRRAMTKYPFGDLIENSYNSQLNVVDLAGSERQISGKILDDRLLESCQINRSLFTLGRVISQLALSRKKSEKLPAVPASGQLSPANSEASLTHSHASTSSFKTPATPQRTRAGRRGGHVSYRDSVLTWLLKESLGGNAVTVVLATISPSSQHCEETLSTLRFAKKAHSVVNPAVINMDPHERVIQELLEENKRLKDTGEVARLERIVMEQQAQLLELTKQLSLRDWANASIVTDYLRDQPSHSSERIARKRVSRAAGLCSVGTHCEPVTPILANSSLVEKTRNQSLADCKERVAALELQSADLSRHLAMKEASLLAANVHIKELELANQLLSDQCAHEASLKNIYNQELIKSAVKHQESSKVMAMLLHTVSKIFPG